MDKSCLLILEGDHGNLWSYNQHREACEKASNQVTNFNPISTGEKQLLECVEEMLGSLPKPKVPYGSSTSLTLKINQTRSYSDAFPSKGETCLHLAARFGHIHVIEYLVRDEAVDVNGLDYLKKTATGSETAATNPNPDTGTPELLHLAFHYPFLPLPLVNIISSALSTLLCRYSI
jgi:hypothetical protein